MTISIEIVKNTRSWVYLRNSKVLHENIFIFLKKKRKFDKKKQIKDEITGNPN